MPQAAAGPAAMAPVAKYPLVLAEDRTRRPDVLRHLKMYEGGWNVTNKHYWAVCVVFLNFKGTHEHKASVGYGCRSMSGSIYVIDGSRLDRTSTGFAYSRDSVCCL